MAGFGIPGVAGAALGNVRAKPWSLLTIVAGKVPVPTRGFTLFLITVSGKTNTRRQSDATVVKHRDL